MPLTVIPVRPTGMIPLTVIEFGTVTAPAVAASHTVALKLTPWPCWRFGPLGLVSVIVSSGGVMVGTAVGVTVTPGVGVGVTRIVLVAVLLLGSLSPLVNTVAVVVNEGAAASISVPVIVKGSIKQLFTATG